MKKYIIIDLEVPPKECVISVYDTMSDAEAAFKIIRTEYADSQRLLTIAETDYNYHIN